MAYESLMVGSRGWFSATFLTNVGVGVVGFRPRSVAMSAWVWADFGNDP